MKYTEPYRQKYAPKEKVKRFNSDYARTWWTPAGSKDVLRLCAAVDSLCLLLEDCIFIWLDGRTSEDVQNRMNMILMNLDK